jgi:hypothetical protein
VDRKLFGTSTIGSHPARSAPAAAPHDPPRSADACRSAIGRPILHEGGETRYEVAIPWRTLGKDFAFPGSRTFLGFGVMVTDIDRSPTGQLTTRTLLDALGGMSWNNPDDFGVLELK